ncbi:MAG: hypothetical protein MZV70_53400 [Desulfobacterales bacterium]|nr:hypothetical protein [Desulfobacterales bacterium]
MVYFLKTAASKQPPYDQVKADGSCSSSPRASARRCRLRARGLRPGAFRRLRLDRRGGHEFRLERAGWPGSESRSS